VRDTATRGVVALCADDTLAEIQAWFKSRVAGTAHQGFPVNDREGRLVGVVTRRDIFDSKETDNAPLRKIIKRPVAVVFEDNSLREAADHMIAEGVGRLPVVAPDNPRKLTGWLTRSDLLLAHRRRLEDASHPEREVAAEVQTVRLSEE
jgi:chloride channel protein, CIC family